MMWLPMFMIVQVHAPGKRRLNLWLPLILLWLLLVGLALLLLPLLLIVILCVPQRKAWLRIAGQVYIVCCALRGLRVDVRDGAEKVKIICL